MVFLLVDFPVTRCYILLFLSSKLMILEKCLILEIVPAGCGPFLHYFKAYAAVPKNQRAATPDPEDRASGCICMVTSRVIRNQGQKNELLIQHAGHRIADVFAVVF